MPINILGSLMSLVAFVVVGIVVVWASGIRILQEYERGVVLMLGRFWKVKGPGLVWVIPLIQTMRVVDTRVVTMDVEPQDVITKDNVSVMVNAVVHFRVVDPRRATLDVQNFLFATSQIAHTSLRSMLGQKEIDSLLSSRDEINMALQKIIHAAGEYQASKKLADAAKIIGTEPATLQLRFLQTLTEIASEKNSTIIFPVPIDLLSSFVKK